MRKWLREVARNRMKKFGYEKINKKRANGRSLFADNWRKFV